MIEFNQTKDKRVYIEKHTLREMMETIENNNNIINTEDMKETSLTDNEEEEGLLVNIKKEEEFACEGEERAEDEPDSDPAPAGGMSPVETATLLLLSRIALFNKVGSPLLIYLPTVNAINTFEQEFSINRIKAKRSPQNWAECVRSGCVQAYCVCQSF